MITEDYVSFEVAKLLKEKGFGVEEETRGYYPIKGDALGRLMFGAEYHHNTSQVQISAPTLQMARKWLRKTYGIDIIIEISNPSVKDRKYYCMIWDGNNNSYILDLFNSYEEAVEAALKYSLKNLI